ncbi:DUF2254 domain-containing protein [Streptomyces gibsoniae]|uniref:DUF2254 domain-containing protein n=1 Tax=Streptomyces gibsoniae TaxID=3075529 RepID=A0ABU2U3S3_9ACTN|nr:DUF2254 domain-containing protein [Streptomyces sp. DSM 41699]MDT0467814.1 DUF2254 domain-containing protein [Streptomyces sp. DSM 41699]
MTLWRWVRQHWEWRREALRTNLWLVPSLEVIGAVALFAVTYLIDAASYAGHVTLPSWVMAGTADSGRQILIVIAGALVTVVGVVFSVIIVALSLASTQFGPRMLRTFIRDRGAQFTLGTYVSTFAYALLVLISIEPGPHGDFVPHLSITVAMAGMGLDVAVLIYFIHHITVEIQLPRVIARIAAELSKAITEQGGTGRRGTPSPVAGDSVQEWLGRLEQSSGVVCVHRSGYLQFIRHQSLVRIAAKADAVILLPYRPGHFLVAGSGMARVWPPEAAPVVQRHLAKAGVTGHSRTLSQDVSFGVDQLVEIALRALSPAVNDTFTALTCIDWLGSSLCQITDDWRPSGVHRDAQGMIRVISTEAGYDRLVQRSFEKIRQAGAGVPAVMIRQLESLAKIMERTTTAEQRALLLHQAEMIHEATPSVPESADRDDVTRRYEALRAMHAERATSSAG